MFRMSRTVTRTFPLPPRELVEGMTGEDYLTARTAHYGGRSAATVTRDGGAVVVRFPRRLPLDALPGPLRSLAGSGELVQVEEWDTIGDDRCHATWHTESSMPGKIDGTFEVVPDGTGSRYTVVANAKVNVPLIGGRLSKEVEGHVVRLVEDEMDFAAEWLERQDQ
jgi:hypothetical protein